MHNHGVEPQRQYSHTTAEAWRQNNSLYPVNSCGSEPAGRTKHSGQKAAHAHPDQLTDCEDRMKSPPESPALPNNRAHVCRSKLGELRFGRALSCVQIFDTGTERHVPGYSQAHAHTCQHTRHDGPRGSRWFTHPIAADLRNNSFF